MLAILQRFAIQRLNVIYFGVMNIIQQRHQDKHYQDNLGRASRIMLQESVAALQIGQMFHQLFDL